MIKKNSSPNIAIKNPKKTYAMGIKNIHFPLDVNLTAVQICWCGLALFFYSRDASLF